MVLGSSEENSEGHRGHKAHTRLQALVYIHANEGSSGSADWTLLYVYTCILGMLRYAQTHRWIISTQTKAASVKFNTPTCWQHCRTVDTNRTRYEPISTAVKGFSVWPLRFYTGVSFGRSKLCVNLKALLYSILSGETSHSGYLTFT